MGKFLVAHLSFLFFFTALSFDSDEAGAGSSDQVIKISHSLHTLLRAVLPLYLSLCLRFPSSMGPLSK